MSEEERVLREAAMEELRSIMPDVRLELRLKVLRRCEWDATLAACELLDAPV